MYKFLLTTAALLLLLPHGSLRAQNTAYGSNALFSNTTGTELAAFGDSALFSNMIGGESNAFGYHALFSATSASGNNAFGTEAMYLNDDGVDNDAFGYQALYSVVSGGNFNCAFGYQALYTNTIGANNVGVGSFALSSAVRPDFDVGVGYQALQFDIGGSSVAVGGQAAMHNKAVGTVAIGTGALSNLAVTGISGEGGVAIGYQTLMNDVSGTFNTAVGYRAMLNNTAGVKNTGLGWEALFNTTGSSNIAVGQLAGINLTTGSNNIDIGNKGVAAEGATIRIGDQTLQTAVYLAGINGTTTTGGLPVYVDSTGRLGIGSTIGISGNSLTLNTNGTAGAPAVLFSGDTTTGLFSTGPGDVSISAAGADQVDVDSAGLHVNNDVQVAGAETILPAPVGSQPAYSTGPSSFTVILSASTTHTSTTAELTIDGNAPVTSGAGQNVLIPPTNASWGYNLTVTGSTGPASRNFRRHGLLKNNGGTISYAGAATTEIQDTTIADTNSTGWALTQITASPGRFKYTVDQGGSTVPVKWTARLEITAVQN